MRAVIGHRASGGAAHWFAASGFAAQAYPFTLMFWGCQTSLNLGFGISISQNSQTVLQNTVCVGVSGAGLIQVQTFDSVANGTAENIIGSHTAFAVQEWHHFAGVWASATDRRIYFDGAQVGSATASRTLTGLDQRRVSGRGNDTSSPSTARWVGWHCEHLFLKIGLTSAQVAAYYAHGDHRVFGADILSYFPCAGVVSNQGSDLMTVVAWPGGSVAYSEPTAAQAKQFSHYSLNEAA